MKRIYVKASTSAVQDLAGDSFIDMYKRECSYVEDMVMDRVLSTDPDNIELAERAALVTLDEMARAAKDVIRYDYDPQLFVDFYYHTQMTLVDYSPDPSEIREEADQLSRAILHKPYKRVYSFDSRHRVV